MYLLSAFQVLGKEKKGENIKENGYRNKEVKKLFDKKKEKMLGGRKGQCLPDLIQDL